MKASEMCRNKSLTMKALFGLVLVACFLPLQVRAQNTITTFLTCVNGLGPNATVNDAVACVPAGCYFTNTLSAESAQPACTLKDGTRLPRVIFSCAGRSQSLRFRPSFSLCTQANTINHIEVGEDVQANNSDDPEVAGLNIQYMADFDMSLATPSFRPFQLFLPAADSRTAVVDAKSLPNSKGCAECHDRKGTALGVGGTFNKFGPVAPLVAEGTISTNDPVTAPPTNQVPLSTICAGISNTNPKLAQALDLCTKLAAKEQ
jgi:hypothetical protein